MRSLRYALVSIIPILLVVIWLFGIMYQAGYAVNVVTSIIGAVSVGIGIDFSTHFTMRFLEERRAGTAVLQETQTTSTTGTTHQPSPVWRPTVDSEPCPTLQTATGTTN